MLGHDPGIDAHAAVAGRGRPRHFRDRSRQAQAGPTDFRSAKLIAASALMLQPMAAQEGCRTRPDIAREVPDQLHGDVGHLRQVLLNLAGNAVKFTERVRSRSSRARLPSMESRALCGSPCTDTGIGIPAAARSRLFEAFEQADAGPCRRRYGGTGLGTTIAKGLTEAMGGSIGFESGESRGSAVLGRAAVRMSRRRGPGDSRTRVPAANRAASPRRRERHRVRRSVPSPSRARAQLQILVADDHAANRMVLQRLLQKAGHRVVCRRGGEAVLDALRSQPITTRVIIDLHMPGLSGLDLLRQLRVMEAGGGRRTPVLVLSADVTPDVDPRLRAGRRARVPGQARRRRAAAGHAGRNRRGRAGRRPFTDVRGAAPVGRKGCSTAPCWTSWRALGMGEQSSSGSSSPSACRMRMPASAGCRGRTSPTNGKQVREHAHALKGVASNLGLVKLVRRRQRTDAACRLATVARMAPAAGAACASGSRRAAPRCDRACADARRAGQRPRTAIRVRPRWRSCASAHARSGPWSSASDRRAASAVSTQTSVIPISSS